MEVQRLDTSKSYGTVIGHDSAMYEQDGKLFGGDMKLLKEEQADPVATQVSSTKPRNAEEFLKQLLDNTAMSKNNVYKEVQIQKQSWDKVQQAAAKLGVHIYQLKGVEMWKLTQD